jgi:hypothetical protein
LSLGCGGGGGQSSIEFVLARCGELLRLCHGNLHKVSARIVKGEETELLGTVRSINNKKAGMTRVKTSHSRTEEAEVVITSIMVTNIVSRY